MMPVHYYVRMSHVSGLAPFPPRPRRRRSYNNLCSEAAEVSESSSKSGESSESENEGSPKRLHRQRSRSISGYISQFFGMGVKDSDTDAKEGDTELPVYGNDLHEVRKSLTVKRVPVLIEDICSIVEEKYICTPGLYSEFEKKKKIRSVISMAKSEYDREKLEELEPSALAGLLKAFLKGLKTPVLGQDLAGMIITIGEYNDISNAKKMQLFARERKLMSRASRATLHYLILHFNKVLQHSSENKLTLNVLCSNLVSSFFPGFVIQYDLKKNPAPMQFLIVYYDLVFPAETKPETPQ